MEIKKVYLDFDCTLVNSIKKIVDMYNKYYQIFSNYKPIHWTEINTWNFEELKAATTQEILDLFEKKEFFDNLEFMDNAYEALSRLNIKDYKLVIVSMGHKKNLSYKKAWVKDNLPHYFFDVEFIGVDLDTYVDKSHIDMSDGVFIDDNPEYLNTNAKVNICFGDVYEWNKDWKGKRCYNWIEVENFLEEVNR